jgi:hypothetical protein
MASEFTKWAAETISTASKGEDRERMLTILKTDPTFAANNLQSKLGPISQDYVITTGNDLLVNDPSEAAREIVDQLKELLKDEIAALA